MNNSTAHFICPFCDSSFPLIDDTYRFEKVDFNSLDIRRYSNAFSSVPNAEELELKMFKCPSCSKITVKTTGNGAQYRGIETNIYPKSLAKQFPDYVPQQIRKDYEEAYSIVDLSPKASATLSRRALQGMIRDFYGIQKNSLFDEIEAIEDKINPTEKPVLNNLRQIGNIGAHPEKDINLIVNIEPGEAEKLLKVIEYFMKSWYVNRHDVQQLFVEVNNTNEKLQEKRKSGK